MPCFLHEKALQNALYYSEKNEKDVVQTEKGALNAMSLVGKLAKIQVGKMPTETI